MCFGPFVGEVVFDCAEEVGAEASFGLGEKLNTIVFEELSEETLREVFGIMLVGAAAADESIERIPILFAELRESFGTGGGVTFFCIDDERPAGLREIALHEVV